MVFPAALRHRPARRIYLHVAELEPFRPFAPLASAEHESLSEPALLPPETLEHGAYYAGKLGTAPVVARWHAKKRRFVLGEFTLGRQCVRSVAHVADSARGERFAPLSKTAPKTDYRVSDYAFETSG
jgi:hypothetical protein